ELSGYPDYMTKEIHEQPAVLRRLAEAGGEHARRLAAMIRDAGDVFVIGCGTASHAALAAQYLLARIAGRRVTVASASEFPYLGDFVGEGALVVALSQRGEAIHTREHLFVIGRGPSYPLALEAALKVKEVSYIHAEGFAGGDLKHGVIALIEPGTPCLVLAPRDETYDDIMAGAMQVKARGAMLIGVSPEPHEAFDYHIPVAELGPATAILNAPPA